MGKIYSLYIKMGDERLELNLTLPVPLSLNQLYINEYGWNPKKKMRTPTGKRILSKEGEKSKKELQEQTIEQMKTQQWDYEFTKDNYLYMDTIIYFNKKGRDDNNVYKLLCDSLEKIVYDNDSRVLVRTQKILFDSENPHIDVKIHPVEYIGIFDNQQQLKEFKSICTECQRNKRNCSILAKAIEGRIQEDVSQVDGKYICSKFKKIKE